jgi:hypothetical protein
MGIEHHEQSIHLNYQDDKLEKELNEYVAALAKQQSLYLDIMVPSQPIILKSNFHEFSCTYKRPYHFLNDCKRG